MVDGPNRIPGHHRPFDPDESFNDDLVGAQAKQREAAQRRAAESRSSSIQTRRAKAYERVIEAESYTPSNEESEAARREKRFKEADARHAETSASRAQGASIREQGLPTLMKSEAAVAELMHEIHALLKQIDLHGGLDALDEAARATFDKEGTWQRGESKSEPLRLADSIVRLNNLNAKLMAAELRVKLQLQQLLAGTTGLILVGDPAMTFKRLLKLIKRWPRRIRPGRIPSTDEEFDSFIAWIFEPPAPPEEPDDLAWP